jgi:hypothetical protein
MNMPTKIVAIIMAFAILSQIFRYYIEKSKSKPIDLKNEEKRIAELFVFTRNLIHKGFIFSTSNGGKLILTNKRLIYCWFDERKITLTVDLNDISSVRSSNEGIVIKKPKIILSYSEGNNLKNINWEVPEQIAKYKNYYSADVFAKLITTESKLLLGKK